MDSHYCVQIIFISHGKHLLINELYTVLPQIMADLIQMPRVGPDLLCQYNFAHS